MRLLVASDLHGSPEAAAFLRRRCEELLPDMLVLLGDYLYHGPRNPLPSSYGPPSVDVYKRQGKRFTSLFLSSVLNSVPFVSDREHIVCICAALCDGDSTLYASARSTKGANWQCHTREMCIRDRV